MTNHFRTHNNRIALTRVCIVAAMCACSAGAIAQDTGAASGPHELLKVSDEQVNVNPVPQTGRLTRAFSWAEAQMDGRSGVRDGWYPEMSGMIPGAGFSAGPGYRHHLFGDRGVVDASAAMSWNGYRMMQSQLTWPRLLNDRLSIGGQVKYQDFTQVNFFGIGNASLKSDQTDYRLKDLDALGFVTVSATPWLSVTDAHDGLSRFARVWRYPVQVVLLCFALVNAGAVISGFGTGTWAVAVAALAGKPAGVLAAVALAVVSGLHLPHRVGWRELTVVAFTASIGFTFALFFATAAIPVGPILVEAKLGALLTVSGSLIAAAAAVVLRVGRFAK